MVVLQDGSRNCKIYSDDKRWEDKILTCIMGFHSVEDEDLDDILRYGYDELWLLSLGFFKHGNSRVQSNTTVTKLNENVAVNTP